jgi:signal transduction histidine kinase
MQSIFGAVHQLRAPEEMELAEIGRLDGILDASRYLISIFDDVLDMNLLENGDARPDSKSFRLLETLESEIESFRSLAREKGVALVLQRRGPLPEYLNSDEGRFRQVVSELLENAVRCTENGSIQVSVGMDQAHDWQEPILRIDVTDTGPGIPEHEVGMVFEPFYKRELPGDERLRPGLGLGLAKRASKLLGGDVVLETEVGRGSVFSFTCETGRLDGVRMLS